MNDENKKVMKLASRGKRFGAYLIDSIIPFVITIAILIAIIGAFAALYSHSYYYDDYGYYGNDNYGGAVIGGGAMLLLVLLLIAYIVVQFVFFARSQTIGKAILGMRVVSSKNGEPIGFWWMAFRELFVKGASSAVFYLGYIWILIDDQNRGWHDKILDTLVVDEKATAMMTAGEVIYTREVSSGTEGVAVKPTDDPFNESVKYNMTAEELAAQNAAPEKIEIVREVSAAPVVEVAAVQEAADDGNIDFEAEEAKYVSDAASEDKTEAEVLNEDSVETTEAAAEDVIQSEETDHSAGGEKVRIVQE